MPRLSLPGSGSYLTLSCSRSASSLGEVRQEDGQQSHLESSSSTSSLTASQASCTLSSDSP